MKDLLKKWQIIILIVAVLLAFGLIIFKGLNFGVDFTGGTLFQIELVEPVKSASDAAQIKSTIQQRLDWTGLKDASVSVLGNEASGYQLVTAQIAETDPNEIENIKTLLLKQGKFEVMLDGNLMINGDDILQVITEAQRGYNYRQEGQSAYVWNLPFNLTESGAKKFTNAAFHQCQAIGFDPTLGTEYDCKQTYFFIDRPSSSVILMDEFLYEADSQLFLNGNRIEDIPAQTDIDDLILNSQIPVIRYTDLNSLKSKEAELTDLQKDKKFIIIHSTISNEIKDYIEKLGFIVKEVKGTKNVPWFWMTSGAKQVISLSEDITNDKPYVKDFSEAKIFNSLQIRGSTSTAKDAQKRLSDLAILLQSGSLPVGVASISEETISPPFGSTSLFIALIIGIVSLITVALVLFIRYRVLDLIIPIIITGFSEVILILGFAALIGWNLDVAAIAGILAVVGTGVDDQIVITDELRRKREDETSASLLNKVKKAFFIIVVAATTTIATMLPIVLFGTGLNRLVGFAITTISGVLMSILITRPAFSEIVKAIYSKRRK